MIKKAERHLKMLIILCLVLIGIHALNIYLSGRLVYLGIAPRDVPELWHIYTAPFIHGSWGHLINNLIGLVIFSALCLMRSLRFWLTASIFIITVGGFLTWALARGTLHVGASGWVFGLWSLLILMGWFDRRFGSIAIAVLVVIFYGGMVFGVLPTNARISFESHLFGAIAGAVFASLFAKKSWAQ